MLDSSGYLSSFGWQGKGNGLRQGSVSRPLAIPQKRTLAGLGKDRDEAFPFWEHLFAAAAKSIQIKVSGDVDEAGENDSGLLSQSSLLRTTTGILSNRRPVDGTPATPGTATPSDVDPRYYMPRLSLLATAKRDSAQKQLYARFFRGEVLGPNVDVEVTELAVATTTATAQDVTECQTSEPAARKSKIREVGVKIKKKRKHDDSELAVAEEKKRKKKRRDGLNVIAEEPKRKKHKNPEDEEKRRKEKQQEKEEDKPVGRLVNQRVETAEERRQRKAAKAERRKRKDERREMKEGRTTRDEGRTKNVAVKISSHDEH